MGKLDQVTPHVPLISLTPDEAALSTGFSMNKNLRGHSIRRAGSPRRREIDDNRDGRTFALGLLVAKAWCWRA